MAEEILEIMRSLIYYSFYEDEKIRKIRKNADDMEIAKIAKKVVIERLSTGDSFSYFLVIKFIRECERKEFLLSSETQQAAKAGIISCLTSSAGKIRQIENIYYIKKNFLVTDDCMASFEVQQACKEAIVDSLSGLYRNNDFYELIHVLKLPDQKIIYCQDVKQASQKGIIDRLLHCDIHEEKIVDVIKGIARNFDIPVSFYSSAEFELAMKAWILRFLDSYHQMSADALVRCGYVSFTDQESEILLNTLKDEFRIVEKIIYFPEVQQTIKERRLAVKSISDEIKKQIKTILSNTCQGPF